MKWLEEAGVARQDLQQLREALDNVPASVTSRLFLQAGGAYFPVPVIVAQLSGGEGTPPERREEVDRSERIPLQEDSPPERDGNRRVHRNADGDPAITFKVSPEETGHDRKGAVSEETELDRKRPAPEETGLDRKRKGCLLCPERPEHLRRHVLAEHLPYWFHLEVACLRCRRVFPTAQERMRHQEVEHGAVERLDTTTYFNWMESARNMMYWLVHVLRVENLEELLLKFVAQEWVPQAGEKWNPVMEAMLRDLSWYVCEPGDHGLYVDSVVSPCQPSNEVEMLYWSSLTRALAYLGEDIALSARRLPFLEDGPDPNNHQMAPELRYPRAIDSHCHLSSCLQGQTDIPSLLERGFREGVARLGHDAPLVVGVINNRVFPSEWNMDVTTRGWHDVPIEEGHRNVEVEVKDTLGVHPSVRPERVKWEVIEDMAHGPLCIGECGLDYTKSNREQRRVFRRLVRRAKTLKRALILHLRPGQQAMLEVMDEALRILRQEGIRADQPIHFHSFTGDHSDYRHWVKQHPNTIFGISQATIRSTRCESFARLADLRKIVLESDAPHLGDATGPHSLSRPAEYLAAVRGLPIRAVYGTTAHVASRFYGIRTQWSA